MKPIRITCCLAAAALLLGCDQVTEPTADETAATPLFAPADGNANKGGFSWDDYLPGIVDCGGGVYLDIHDVGWGQRFPASGTTDKGRKKWVWHIEMTYVNPASGRTYKVHDVGPDKWYIDQDGNTIHTITGRSVTGSGIIGHVVEYWETGEIIHISGRPAPTFDELDAAACAKLG